MSEHNLSSHKPLSPTRRLERDTPGPCSRFSQWESLPLFSSSIPVCGLRPPAVASVGQPWDLGMFVSFLNPSPREGRDLFVEDCAKIRLGRIFREIAS